MVSVDAKRDIRDIIISCCCSIIYLLWGFHIHIYDFYYHYHYTWRWILQTGENQHVDCFLGSASFSRTELYVWNVIRINFRENLRCIVRPLFFLIEVFNGFIKYPFWHTSFNYISLFLGWYLSHPVRFICLHLLSGSSASICIRPIIIIPTTTVKTSINKNAATECSIDVYLFCLQVNVPTQWCLSKHACRMILRCISSFFDYIEEMNAGWPSQHIHSPLVDWYRYS